MGSNLKDPEAISAVGYLPMGLVLFLTFIFCGFTETDRRARYSGFPRRLFTLPLTTRLLIAVPIVISVIAVSLVYLVWASLVLLPLGRRLPLAWPALYLASGMICYQTAVWSLATFRLTRLLVLGIGGTFFLLGWIAFRNDFERELLSWLVPANLPLRPVLSAFLCALSFLALLCAWLAVESQRRGGVVDLHRWKKTFELAGDFCPRSCAAHDSPARAQFWYEWRRHGVLLPLATTGVLFLIMAPGPFIQPISPAATAITVGWILLLPFLLAFMVGFGFGKPDLWAADSRLPLFLATRPLAVNVWVAAKMKAAAWAALVAWAVVAILTPWWVCLWGDWQSLAELWGIAQIIYSPAVLTLIPVTLFLACVLVTWSLLAGNLFIGLSGKNWMLMTAACLVFLALLGTPMVILSIEQHPAFWRHLLWFVRWIPWALATLFALKVVGALLMAEYSQRKGWLSKRSTLRYILFWSAATGFFLLALWLLAPVDGWLKWLLILLGLFAVPLFRPAYAPIALARNRQN